MALPAGSKVGPYEILTLLGAGGMGEVYRARDTRLGREVAVKVLPASLSSDPERLRRFEQEARAASLLNHPNILVIHDLGTQDGVTYIVSELLEGENLRERLGGTALPQRKAIDYALQVARGLAAAHEKNIVHRDLKPENIFILKDGRVKILDFGLAKLVQPEAAPQNKNNAPTISGDISQPGTVLGTVGYMAPEQVRGQVADHRADIFAFGAILYEMLSGQRAFKRETAAETMTAILKEDPPELAAANPNISSALERLVSHCLEKSPEQRFQSARDLEFALATVSGFTVSGIAPKPEAQVRARLRLRPLLWGAAVALVIAVGAFMAGRNIAPVLPARHWTFHARTFRLGHITGARFAPDGRNIVYSAFWDDKPLDIYMTSTEGPESRSLGLAHDGLLAISSTGEMAITLGCEMNWGGCMGTLARVPLTGGAPRQVLDNVSDADWSPDGKDLAVAHLTGGGYRLEYPVGKVLYESPGWLGAPKISPDGKLVAFFDSPVLGEPSGSVCVVDLAGKKRTLSSGWKTVNGIEWSPKGDEIWFVGIRHGVETGGALYGVSLTGNMRVIMSVAAGLALLGASKDGTLLFDRQEPRASIICLAPGESKERELYWFDWSTAADLSPDGKGMLFYEWGDAVDGVNTVYFRKTDGSPAVRLGEGKPLALSPDGAWALVVQQTTAAQLALLPTGAGQAKVLPHGAVSEFYLGGWFPDGHHIFFAGAERGHPPQTFVQSIDGGEPQAATSEGVVAALLSPDGSKFAAVDRYGEYNLVPVGGGDSRPIDGLNPGDQLIQWSSDGRSLFVRAPGNMDLKVLRLNLETGKRELWRNLKPSHATGLIGIATDPGQVRITPDGKSYVYTYWTVSDQLFTAKQVR